MKNFTKALEVCVAICRNGTAAPEDIKWARKELVEGLNSLIFSYDAIKLLVLFSVLFGVMKILC